jgi:hypothetical protein
MDKRTNQSRSTVRLGTEQERFWFARFREEPAMQQPTWFDKKYDKGMEKATAEECLAQISKDPTIVKAVKEALTGHDSHKGPGPTRTQAVRGAVCKALEAVS